MATIQDARGTNLVGSKEVSNIANDTVKDAPDLLGGAKQETATIDGKAVGSAKPDAGGNT